MSEALKREDDAEARARSYRDVACALRTICSPEFLKLEFERHDGDSHDAVKCLPHNDGGKLVKLMVSTFKQLVSDDVLGEAGTQGAEVAFFLKSMFVAYGDLDDFAAATCDSPAESESIAWNVFHGLIMCVFEFLSCDQPQYCASHARAVRQCAKFLLSLLRQFRGADVMLQRLMDESAASVQQLSTFATQCGLTRQD